MIKIILTADSSGVVKAFSDAGQQITQFEAKVSGISGKLKATWVNIAAGINIVQSALASLSEAWHLAMKAAEFEEQKRYLQMLSSQYNTTADSIINSIKKVTDGQVSMAEAANMAAQAMNIGLKPDQIIELAGAAEKLGDVVGTDLTDAYDAMITAAAKGRMGNLAMMGVTVELDDAYKKVAKSLGKTVDELTEAEKATIRYKAVTEAVNEKVSRFGDMAETTADKMNRLSATVKDLSMLLGTILIRAGAAALGTLSLLGAGIVETAKTIISPLVLIEQGLNKLGISSSTHFQDTFKIQSEWSDRLKRLASDNFAAVIAKSEDLMAAMNKQKTVQGQVTEMTDKQRKAFESLSMAIAEFQNKMDMLNPAINQNQKEVMDLWNEYDKLIEKIQSTENLTSAQKEAFKDLAREALFKGLEFITDKQIAESNAKLVELERSFNDFWEDVEIASKEGIDKSLAEVDRWVKKSIDQYGYTENAINKITEEGERRKTEIIEKENQRLFEEQQKDLEEMWKAEEEYYEMTFEATASELDKKLHAWDNWYKKVIELLEKLELEDEEFNKRSLEAFETMMKKKDEIMQEANKGFIEGIEDATKEYIDHLQWGYERAKNLTLDLAQALEDTLVRMFDEPKKAIQDFARYFIEMLKRLIVQALMNPIIIQISAVVTGSLGQMIPGMTAPLLGAGNMIGGTGLLGNLFSGAGLLSYVPGLLGWGGLGYGLGSLFGGYGGIGGALGGALGYAGISGLLGSGVATFLGQTFGSLFNFIPGLGVLIGGFLGGLLEDLFGGEKKIPKMGLAYSETGNIPNMKYGGIYGVTLSGEHVDERGITQTPTWAYISGGGVEGDTEEFMRSVAEGFKNVSLKVKEILSDLGLDITGFSKDWSKTIELEGKTQEQVMAELEQMMGEYIEFASGIDFEQFQRDGEKLIDTVTRMIDAMALITSVKDWDIQKMYNDINLHQNTYKEALNEIDKQLSDAIDALPTLTGEEWGNKITEIGELTKQRYELEIQYLTYIKSLAESITEDINKTIESIQLEGMTREQKIDYYNQKLQELYEKMLATIDPTELQQLYEEMKNYWSAGWSLMTEEEKKKFGQASIDFWNDVKAYLQKALQDAVTAEEEAVKSLQEKLDAIDWTPLYNLSDAAQAAANSLKNLSTQNTNENIPSYQSGLDYVPYDNYIARLHSGEAVITAQGNRALQKLASMANEGTPIVINVSGDIAPFIQIAAETGANRAINIIKRNPAVMR